MSRTLTKTPLSDKDSARANDALAVYEATDLAGKVRFRRLVTHLHRLGSRPIAEFIREVVGNDTQILNDAMIVLERYSDLDPEMVRAVGADTFPTRFLSEVPA